jgi:hypothetical protein
MAQRSLLIYGTAFAVSVLILVVSYFPFYWLLVQIQTWRLGHPNPFVIGPSLDAILCSLLAAGIVFWWVVDGPSETPDASRLVPTSTVTLIRRLDPRDFICEIMCVSFT